MSNSVYLIDYDVIAQRAHITYDLKNKQVLQISIVWSLSRLNVSSRDIEASGMLRKGL